MELWNNEVVREHVSGSGVKSIPKSIAQVIKPSENDVNPDIPDIVEDLIEEIPEWVEPIEDIPEKTPVESIVPL